MPSEKEEKRAEWSFINLFPFVPSEPAGIQHFSLTLSLSCLPSPNSRPLSLAHSDVIVSCPVDADAQLKAVCTDPQLNVC